MVGARELAFDLQVRFRHPRDGSVEEDWNAGWQAELSFTGGEPMLVPIGADGRWAGTQAIPENASVKNGKVYWRATFRADGYLPSKARGYVPIEQEPGTALRRELLIEPGRLEQVLVVDTQGAPISGAKVIAHGLHTTGERTQRSRLGSNSTDSNGSATLRLRGAQITGLTFEASSERVGTSDPVEWVAGEVTTLECAGPGQLHGRLLDVDGLAVRDVSVSAKFLRSLDGPQDDERGFSQSEVTTNDDGCFHFEHLRHGVYEVDYLWRDRQNPHGQLHGAVTAETTSERGVTLNTPLRRLRVEYVNEEGAQLPVKPLPWGRELTEVDHGVLEVTGAFGRSFPTFFEAPVHHYGSFAVSAGSRDYLVDVDVPLTVTAFHPRRGQVQETITVSRGGPLPTVTLQARPERARGRLDLRVLDSARQPFAGECGASLQSLESGRQVWSRHWNHRNKDPRRAEVTLLEGQYELVVYKTTFRTCGFGGPFSETHAPHREVLRLESGQPRVVDAILHRAGHLKLRAIDQEGLCAALEASFESPATPATEEETEEARIERWLQSLRNVVDMELVPTSGGLTLPLNFNFTYLDLPTGWNPRDKDNRCLTDIPPGEYWLQGSGPGVAIVPERITITADQWTEAVVRWRPADAPLAK
ncbi:MAG: carboxypeptidase-like regulatory domain-containing protein [Planctomycetota bacterium]